MMVGKVQPVTPLQPCPKLSAENVRFFFTRKPLLFCAHKCNAVGWCVMCAELDVKWRSVDIWNWDIARNGCTSVCRHFNGSLSKQNYFQLLNKTSLSVDAHFYPTDTELCCVIHRIYMEIQTEEKGSNMCLERWTSVWSEAWWKELSWET